MGLFGKKSEGGLMDVIRCDEQEYLVWKWRPSGGANSTNKENSIRYGSSLRVKDGELAVFVYTQKDGSNQDYIIGPYDQTIQTANFPGLASLVGSAFGGSSPFQAEIYFINLSGNVQIKFGIPYFDVFDPRFLDFAVPMAVRGTLTFNLTEYREFIKLNRLINFELEDFKKQIKDALTKYIKSVISNIPTNEQIPVLQIERKLLEINEIVAKYLKPRLENDFGINLKNLDLATIEPDKESQGYYELRKVTSEQTDKKISAETDISINNLEANLQIQREEAQRLQKLQTETNFINTHIINQQSDALKTAAASLGNMGTIDSSNSGMNSAGMMTGMMVGGSLGNQMANMMNQAGNSLNQQQNVPPPINIQYSVSIDGQTLGPYNLNQLSELVLKGQISKSTYVWKQGMPNWEIAGNLTELNNLFNSVPPPPPPPPHMS